jgi:hypothetical protein
MDQDMVAAMNRLSEKCPGAATEGGRIGDFLNIVADHLDMKDEIIRQLQDLVEWVENGKSKT